METASRSAHMPDLTGCSASADNLVVAVGCEWGGLGHFEGGTGEHVREGGGGSSMSDLFSVPLPQTLLGLTPAP